MSEQQWSPEKFQEAILYVSQRSVDDPKFGSVKLNKILYYADFWSFTKLGRSITGATYQHLPEGPAPRELLTQREELIQRGELRIESRVYHHRSQKRPVAQRDADRALFSPDELALLDEAIEYLRPFDAAEVSDLSHREWGWRLTSDGDVISYRTAWLSAEPLDQEQVEFGERLALDLRRSPSDVPS